MSATSKFLGAGAFVMALCCALLPVAGAAIGGGLIASAGPVGIVAGVAVLGAVVAFIARRRQRNDGC